MVTISEINHFFSDGLFLITILLIKRILNQFIILIHFIQFNRKKIETRIPKADQGYWYLQPRKGADY